jgi:hypothetical protein
MEKSNSSPTSLPSGSSRMPAGERQSYLLLVIGFAIAGALPYLIHPPVSTRASAPTVATASLGAPLAPR